MILLTGGSGLLGTELQKHIECYAPPRTVLDVTMPGLHYCSLAEWALHETKMTDIDLIVHCAAYTDVAKAEIEKDLCYKTNVIGTRNMASLKIPMLYISTSYVFDGEKGNYNEKDYPNPVNFYGLTKLLGEYEAKNTKVRILRCLFKPSIYKHDIAPTDQFASPYHVEEMAKEVSIAIRLFDSLNAITNIGSYRQSLFNFARKTKEVKPCLLSDIKSVKLPKDTSLDCTLWRNLCK